jgi:hypothetical protein
MARVPGWKSFWWDEIFAGDGSDAGDVTLPTFKGRDADVEVAGRCLIKPVDLQCSQSSVTSVTASHQKADLSVPQFPVTRLINKRTDLQCCKSREFV